MIRLVLFFVLAFILEPAVAATPGCDPGRASDDERFTELSLVLNEHGPARDDFDGLAYDLLDRFASLWCDSEYGADLEQAEDAVVSLRLRAARSVSFYARPDWVLERHRAVVAQAHARGLADSSELRDLVTAYQAAGQYETAREIRAEYPDADLPEVPRVMPPPDDRSDHRSGDARLVWQVDGEDNRLRGEWLPVDGPQLLVVTSPGCRFCWAAAQDLTGDDILAPLVRKYSAWLAEPSMANTFGSVTQWNERYPEVATMLVDDPDAWKVSGFEQTPRFYFMRDGEAMHKLVGWQGGSEALGAIAEGFERLDLLDRSQLPDNAFADAEKPSGMRGCPERSEARERIRERAAINTRDDLERHLADIEAGVDSPLRRFSTEGRKRFVSSMHFHDDDTLAGFDHGELEAQLEPDEIYEVTALFGQQYFFAGMLFEPEMLGPEEKQLKAMFECRSEH